jgi:hypothetical protein
VLTTSEIVQAAKDAVGGAVSVSVNTRQREVDLDVTVALALTGADRAHGVTKRATTTIDEPEVKIVSGKTTLTFGLDRLDRGRWVVTGAGGSQSLVGGLGDVARLISMAGLPLASRGPVPSKLSVGEPRSTDTTAVLR